MNPNETTPPDHPVAADDKTAPSVSEFGSRPSVISETDITAVPGSGTNTDIGGDAPKPVDINAATITAMSASVVNLFGQYELLGEIARGGMGVVHRARQRGLDRLVALKMVLGMSGDHDSALQRFMLEARAAAALDHPNVVPIYDSGEIDGKVFFTMALVEGPNLKHFVENNGLPAIPHAISLFAQIVAGVAHAHAAGIIHRDLKPANVLMDKDGRPRVTDFGLAKKASGNSELTGTGQIMGTPAYMPPEQARDSKEVGPPADVYSLGAILYFLLTGRPPFTGESVPDLLIKVVSEDPQPPSQLNPAVPPELEALCLRCLAKAPTERFADARDLAEALIPIVETYVPRSTHSLHAISRSTGALGDSSRSGLSGLSSTVGGATGIQAPPPKSKMRVVALAAIAGLLAAVAIYLGVFGGPKKIQNKIDPNAVALNNKTDAGTQTPAEKGPQETSIWPEVAASEFKLTTELISDAKPDKTGVIQLPNRTVLKIKLKADKDCSAAVYWIDPKGATLQLFPNQHDVDGHLTAGAERVIPGGGKDYDLVTIPTEGDGFDLLRIYATTGPISPSPSGDAEGNFILFKTPEQQERLASHVRGIVVRQKSTGRTEEAPKVAGAVIKFRVNP